MLFDFLIRDNIHKFKVLVIHFYQYSRKYTSQKSMVKQNAKIIDRLSIVFIAKTYKKSENSDKVNKWHDKTILTKGLCLNR